VAGEMIDVTHTSLDLSERGLISRPTIARGSREWQLFFVNGRPIRSGRLAVMLERPYAGRLPPDRHPLAIVHIEVNPQFIDVNVHPRKAEVRFYQERAIYGTLTHAVDEALREFPLTFQAGGTDWSFADTPLPGCPAMVYEPRAEYYAGPWRALAQLNRTFILAQSVDGLLVVDQHSAPEQIFFERLTAGQKCFVTPARRAFCYAKDLARVVVRAADGTGHGTYHFSSGKDVAIRELYDAVTAYVRDEFNRAERLDSDRRRGNVGFAMTVLQRRLASSTAAIAASLTRRREGRERRLRAEP